MEETDEEMNIVEASGGKNESENDNNNNVEKTKTLNDGKKQSDELKAKEKIEKRKKLYFQYIYQQDYEEALRSLLWEPYDCRDDFSDWNYLNDNESRGITSKVPKPIFFSSSESSFTSSSSCSSFDEILTQETKQRNEFYAKRRNGSDAEVPKECNKRPSCLEFKKLGRDLNQVKTIEMSALLFESKLKEEEEHFKGFTKSKCTTDPVQNQMDVGIMVSDLHYKSGDGISSCKCRSEAQKLHSTQIGASASQYEFGRELRECCDAYDQKKDELNAVYKMLVTVEGTLEPRDSNEGTHLVSPDTSLDLNDNPVRLSSTERTEPGPSCGNVSVVNCYRAVPVSVVSTVPTIKCLNTQESVCNVNIIQTSSSSDQKLSAIKHPQTPQKRQTTRGNNALMPSTSRVRTKAPNRETNKNLIRQSAALDQNGVNSAAKMERPKSANACLGEMKCETTSQTPICSETSPTDSNDGNLAISNHNRSVSNPVLGNQIKLVQNRFGSQQNIPIRLETHFGPNSPDGVKRSQCVMQRSDLNSETSAQQQIVQETDNEVMKPSPRTFTSTEAQTDDLPLGVHSRSVHSREQRRRERRERRHQRRLHQNVLNSNGVWQTNVDIIHRDRRGLPDILNSHMPPPYSAVSVPPMPTMSPSIHPVPPPMVVSSGPQTMPHLIETSPGQPLPHQNSFRFPFPFPGGGRSCYL